MWKTSAELKSIIVRLSNLQEFFFGVSAAAIFGTRAPIGMYVSCESWEICFRSLIPRAELLSPASEKLTFPRQVAEVLTVHFRTSKVYVAMAHH